ncbi:MAG TPA: YdeI/OmpD-associated family protein [Chryseolinea sp.]
MIQFSTTILRFASKGEKTGWSYVKITPVQARKLNPGCNVSFRVKGKIDNYAFEKVALLPMGEGNFIMPMNAKIRKAIEKQAGSVVQLTLMVDKREIQLSQDLMNCLAEEPDAKIFFKSLPKSHQNYFSNWIESAKTAETKTKRIVMAVNAMTKRQDFGAMIRANKNKPY